MTVMTLAEKTSPLWIKLKGHMNARIDELRNRMESLTTPPEEMLSLRHRIKELRQLMGIEENMPEEDDDNGQ